MTPRSQLIDAFFSAVRPHVPRGQPLDSSTSVIDSGLVDSFTLAEVISGIETALSIRLPVDRMSPGDFDSAELLAARLEQLGVVEA